MPILVLVRFQFPENPAYRDPDCVTHRRQKNLTCRRIRFSEWLGQSIWHEQASRIVHYAGRWGTSMPTKSPEKKASEGKPNALQKPLQPSEELAAVVGASPVPRGEVVSKIWKYIRANNLQNPENRREILA